MKTIKDYLEEFRAARLGRDVQNSMVDCIEMCYKDATGHPESVAAVVRKTEVLSERINEMQKLPEGSTTGDAALADICVPADGFGGNGNYKSPGDAVREQVEDIAKAIKAAGIPRVYEITGKIIIINGLFSVGDRVTLTPMSCSDQSVTGLNIMGMYEAGTTGDYDLLVTGAKFGETVAVDLKRNYHHLQVSTRPYKTDSTFRCACLMESDGVINVNEIKEKAEESERTAEDSKAMFEGTIEAVDFGEYIATKASVIKNITLAEGDYNILIWDIAGMPARNPACYTHTGGTFVMVDNPEKREVGDGYIMYNISVDSDTDYVRLYAGILTGETECRCRWAVFKADRNIIDYLYKRIRQFTDSELAKTKKGRMIEVANYYTASIIPRIVCVGDSYTAGFHQVGSGTAIKYNPDYAWPHYASLITGNEWINCGVSGASSLTWITAEGGLKKAKGLGKAPAYVVGLMINDIQGATPVPLGSSDDIGSDAPSTYYGGMAKVIKELNAISPGSYIFVNTCPRSGTAYTDQYLQYNDAVRDIVQRMSADYNVHCIDLESYKDAYNDNSVLTAARTVSNGHYTAIGYQQMASMYVQILSSYINENVDKFMKICEI